MENKPITGKISDMDTVADMDVAPVGEPDADTDNNPLRSLQSTAVFTETAQAGATNSHTLPTEKIRMQPPRT